MIFENYLVKVLVTLLRDQGKTSPAEIINFQSLLAKINNDELSFDEIQQQIEQLFDGLNNKGSLADVYDYFASCNLPSQLMYLFASQDLMELSQDLTILSPFLFEDGVQFYVNHQPGQPFELTLEVHDALVPQRAIVHQATILFLLYLCRTIAGKSFDFISLHLPDSKNKNYLSEITSISKAKIKTGQTHYKVVFEESWLDRVSFNYNPILRQKLLELFNTQLEQDGDHHPFIQTVIEALDECFDSNNLTMSQLFRYLKLTDEEVKAKLRNEGITFKALYERWVFERATECLMSTTLRIEDVASKLGFSERLSFERNFKRITGASVTSFRQYAKHLKFGHSKDTFQSVIDSLPPVKETSQNIISLPEETVTVAKLVELLEQDPVFSARIMGLASRAIYGSQPASLSEAIARNLGINKIKSLAVVFMAGEQLQDTQKQINAMSVISSAVLSSDLLTVLAKQSAVKVSPSYQQLIGFGLLGLLLLFHKENLYSKEFVEIWQSSQSLAKFNQRLSDEYDVSIYQVSASLLASWGLPAEFVKQLSSMDDLLKHDDTTAILINRVQDVATTFCFGFEATEEYWIKTAQDCHWQDVDLLSTQIQNVCNNMPQF